MGQDGAGAPYTVPLVIGGEDHYPNKTFDVVSPATGQLVHRCGSASVADADAAVDAAAEAFKTWRNTTPAERRAIFMRAADIMERRSDELAKYMTDETGATAQWARANFAITTDLLRDAAGRIPTIDGSFPATRDPASSCIIMREPYGVVLAIAPWNAPYILGTRSVAFPVAAGNTVVLKGTELAPRTMWSIVSVFAEAGLPKGVINMVAHEPAAAPAVTAALVANPLVRKVNFTGSTAVGRIIGRLAGENVKPAVMELGGKAPAIVWHDADLQLAADQCALGSFNNAGQVCMCTERILVHKDVKARFQELFAASVERIFSSDEDAAVLINSAAVDKNRKLVKDAISKGASLLLGNQDAVESSATRMRPLVLGKVTTGMDIYKQESFGPTVSLIDVETEDEAIQIANDTEYGLTSAVFTEDLRRGLRFAKAIESGAVHINSMSIHDEASLPHGGAKSSGYGRFNARNGLEEWVRTKSVTFKN